MNEKKLITIANFNCTFKNENTIHPMLDYFESMLLPALLDHSLSRKTISRTKKVTEYFITNIKLMEIEESEIILVGELVKRVILEIRQDFSTDIGYIPKGENIPSAPYSTFAIFLRNHRVIFFPDQPGSPNIRNFSTVIDNIVGQYRSSLYLNSLNKLESNGFIFNDKKIENRSNFDKEFSMIYPIATINVVPIPSEKIVEDRFKDIKKVKSLSFKLYNLNSEIDDEPMFAAIKEVMNKVDSNSSNAIFTTPKNIDKVKNYAEICNGKYDFRIDAVGKNKEQVIVKPDSLSEQIPIIIDNSGLADEKIKLVYNNIKDRKEITSSSSENSKVYSRHKDRILQLIKIIK